MVSRRCQAMVMLALCADEFHSKAVYEEPLDAEVGNKNHMGPLEAFTQLLGYAAFGS